MTVSEVKWSEVSIDFVTDLLALGDAENSIMIVVHCATKMVHFIPCKESTTSSM